MKNQENIPADGVKYKFSKKHNTWVRTYFSIEKDDNGSYFRQNVAFSGDRQRAWEKWAKSPSNAGK